MRSLNNAEIIIHVKSIATAGAQYTLTAQGTSYLCGDQDGRGVYEMSRDTIMRNHLSTNFWQFHGLNSIRNI